MCHGGDAVHSLVSCIFDSLSFQHVFQLDSRDDALQYMYQVLICREQLTSGVMNFLFLQSTLLVLATSHRVCLAQLSLLNTWSQTGRYCVWAGVNFQIWKLRQVSKISNTCLYTQYAQLPVPLMGSCFNLSTCWRLRRSQTDCESQWFCLALVLNHMPMI